MKINEIFDFIQVYRQIENDKMAVSTAYHLSKIAKKAQEALTFYQETYNKNLEQYAEPDEENGGFKLTEDQKNFILKEDTIEEAKEAFDELNEHDFPMPTISFDELKELSISPADLSKIMPFIEE